MLESLQQREEELHKKIKEIQDLHLSFDMYHKVRQAIMLHAINVMGGTKK